jgi:hypothetical protein
MARTSSRVEMKANRSTEFVCGELYEDGDRVVMCILGANLNGCSRVIKNGVVLHSKISSEIGGVILDIDSPQWAFTDFRGTLVLES